MKKNRIFVFAFLCVVAALLYKLYHQFHLPIRYPNFGIFVPANYAVHGIDVSRYQGNINWEEVANMEDRKTKLSFVFIKATQGTYLTDRYFKRNWKQSYRSGIVRGAYHYFDMNQDAIKQANHFVRNVSLVKGDLAPVLDIEETKGYSAEKVREKCNLWLNLIKKHYGIRPIIYTNVSFYEDYLGEYFDEYPLWVAHYHQALKPRIKRKWHFWQHSDKGNVNGIEHYTDFNVFRGDWSEIASYRLE